jgi:hypothetical protein
MSKFANVYWSSDYKTGVSRLNQQSLRSIQQLHELRHLVFSFMNYYHSNGEHLNKLSIESFPIESALRPFDRDALKVPPRHQGSNHEQQLYQGSVPNQKRLNQPSDSSKERSPPISSSDSLVGHYSISTAYGRYVDSLVEESNVFVRLASAIDREVLEKITLFLKFYEAKLRSSTTELINIFLDYESTFHEVESIKEQYYECLRMKEFSESSRKPSESEDRESETETKQESASDNSEEIEPTPPLTSSETSLDSEFNFPLIMGPLKVTKSTDLSKLLKKLVGLITTIRRKIPIPGYRNEIYSSDQLCQFFIKNRAFGMDPTRVNLEKFGQSLIDLKLIVSTNFLGANKFKSESMWFEWTELAIYVSEFDVANDNRLQSIKLPTIDETTTKFMNDMAQNTSKKFNGMFKSVKTSLLKTNYSEQIVDLQEKYSSKYMDLQQMKHLLDTEIFNYSQFLEKFEINKIEIVYHSLAKLLEIIYNSSLNSTNNLHRLATDFIKKINKPENYENDLRQLVEDFSSGIYFPSSVNPDNIKNNGSSNQYNNNIQNLKCQFNLYKDVLLQVQVGKTSLLLILTSIPQFLYDIIQVIKEKEEAGKSEFWTNPLDHQDYWVVKQNTIQTINNYEPSPELEHAKEDVISAEIIEQVVQSLKNFKTHNLINFLKIWMLEINDSLIPYIVYDSIINLYKSKSEDENTSDELEKILSTIPRSNLASVIFILEHICLEFDLAAIPGYGYSDELLEDLNEVSDTEKVNQAVNKLNSMDAIGAVPFVHLILRLSPVRASTGFKPPLDIYNRIIRDLLDVKTRSVLITTLVEHERNYIAKKENERNSLQVKKLPNLPPQPTIINIDAPTTPSKPVRTTVLGTIPKSPRPLSGDFTLRPFRTKATPNPSPSSSPRHTPKNSIDMNGSVGDSKLKKNRESPKNIRDTQQYGRARSTSSSLTPNIEVEFEDA